MNVLENAVLDIVSLGKGYFLYVESMVWRFSRSLDSVVMLTLQFGKVEMVSYDRFYV